MKHQLTLFSMLCFVSICSAMNPSLAPALTMAKYSSLVEEQAECSICLDPLEKNRSVTPCQHVFHKNCIDKWKKQKNGTACPLCRAPLSTDPSSFKKLLSCFIGCLE